MTRSLLALASVVLPGTLRIAAAQSAGAPDPSYETGSSINGAVQAVAPLADGKAYIGGEFTTVRGAVRNHLARLAADGAVDPTFDPGVGANNHVECLAVQADGKLIIGGSFTSYDGTARNRIARIHPDGSLDPTFAPGAGPNGVVTCVAVQGDGRILIGGWFNTYGGVPRSHLARLLADGSLDPGFDPGSGASSGVLAVAVAGDGKVLAGGHFATFDGVASPHLVRLEDDGDVDATFDTGSGPSGLVSSLAVQPDGKILIGGSFTEYDGASRRRIARLEGDGNLDAAFDPGSGANATVSAISLAGDGRILIGGWFTSFNGTPRSFVARLEAGGGLDAGFDPGGGAQGIVFSVATRGDGKSYVGGQFNGFDERPFSFLARLGGDGALDTAFMPGAGRNGGVNSTALQPDGNAVVAGDFTSIDGSARSRIARLLGNGALDPSFDPGDGADGRIEAVAVLPDGRLLVAGDFTSYDGVARGRIARLQPDGALDPTFDPGAGADGSISCLALQPDGNVLIGGDFTEYDGTGRQRIARLLADGGLDATFDPGLGADAIVSALVLQPDGKVVLAGDFVTFDGGGIGRIIRLDPDGGIDATFDQVSLADGLISCLAIQPDGKLLLAGDFARYDAVERGRVARINTDGSLDATFDPGSGVNGPVSTMALQADGKLLLGGGFSLVDETIRQNLVRLNADGGVDAGFDPGPGSNGPVHSLALQRDGGILVGGDFTTYGDSASSYLARALNDPAVQGFDPVDPGHLQWARGGAAPELEQVSFDFSADGLSWSPLGPASRISGGWERTGLSLPKSGFLRARGRAAGGINSGSSSYVEQVASYVFPPEISVEHPVGEVLMNGVDEVDFGSFALGASSVRTFTIRNLGYGDLSDIVVTLSGADAGDFSVTDAPGTTLLPGESTAFTIELAPGLAGDKTAVLSIASNDEERDPFEIALSGTMLKGTQTISFANPGPQPATAILALSATGGASGNAVTFSVTGPAQLSGNSLSFTGAGPVTVTAQQAGNANYHPADPVERTFEVSAVPALVTLTNLSHVYDGTPKTAVATTDPAGLPVEIDYGGSAPVDAGSHPVTATVADPRYVGSAAGTLVVAKAAQAIAFPSPGDQLATATVALSATGGGSGNAIVFSANAPGQLGGNTLTFTGPGSVTVRANQAGNANYEAAPEVAHTFDVSAAAATLTLSRLHQVADGTAREVVVTTDPAGLAIEVTYDGGPDAPTAPGSYAVAAASGDARYEGSAAGTLVVDDPSRSVVVPGGGLPALSALGELLAPTFRVGAYEVTGSEWATVVAWAEAEAGYDFAGAGSAAGGDRPVTGVGWFDAAKWCNARTERENALLGRSLAPAYRVGGAVYKTGVPASPADLTCDFGAGGHRLPTAAEWEYAARGGASGTPSTYPGGDALDGLGWHAGNSGGAVQPAGGKTANGLDLHDLAGNAAEWTWDGPSGAPGQRFLRGGAWSSAASACELTALSGEPAALALDRSGFRVANSVSLALAAALDHPDLTWESGGDEPWFAQTSTTHDGIDAAESGPLSQGRSSWVETTVAGPGNLRFRWKTAGAEGEDLLAFAIDSAPARSRDGAGDWEEQSLELGAGPHTLRWTHTQGSPAAPARAWLDAVEYETASPPSVTTAASAGVTGASATLGGEVADDGRRTVTARGVVYGTSPDPALGGGALDLPAAEGGEGAFVVSAAGLGEGTTYFARAYATNNLGTSYGPQVAFTTRTAVAFVDGVAVHARDILPGGRHAYDFVLAGPRFVTFASAGGAPLRAELRNAAGDLVAAFAGDADFDFEELLLAGGYVLEVHRLDGGGGAQGYTLTIDASVVAETRPDVSVGATAARLTGGNAFLPRLQLSKVTSKKAKPVKAYAGLSNRGNLPDRLKVRASGGNAFFKVAYFGPEGNLTAALVSGSYRTAELDNAGGSVIVRAAVAPNKRKLTKKKGKRSSILKKTLSLSFNAASTFDPSLRDGATIKVQTK